jgi:uncharacterized protein YjbI with pentapeptide repeats
MAEDNDEKGKRWRQLETVLEDHREYLESGGSRGSRADFSKKRLFEDMQVAGLDLKDTKFSQASLRSSRLSNCHLDNSDLSETILAGCIIEHTSLRGAKLCSAKCWDADIGPVHFCHVDLSQADLRGADLSNAVFEDVSVDGAHFEGAILRNSTFGNVSGLDSRSLRGCDLTGAHLPLDIGQHPEIGTLQDAVRHLERLVLFALVCFLTSASVLVSTSNISLLSGSFSAKIVGIDAVLPIATYLTVCAIVFAASLVYAELNVGRMVSSLSAMPARLPDHSSPIMLVHSWIVNVSDLDSENDSHSSRMICLFASFWPMLLMRVACLGSILQIWYYTMLLHRWVGATFQALLLAVAVTFIAAHSLERGSQKWALSSSLVRRSFSQRVINIIAIGLVLISILMPVALSLEFGGLPLMSCFAMNLSGAKVESLDLSDRSFAALKSTEASFKKVDLRNCNLHWTDFRKSNLDSVDFRGANLSEADFSGAILTKCRFRKSDISQSTVIVNLQLASSSIDSTQ